MHKVKMIRDRSDAKALLVRHPDADGDQWVPRSQVTDITEDYKEGDTVDIEIETWLAEKLGWE